MKSCDMAPKLERKTVEKNRRLHMKSLLFKLSSLLPKDQNYSKDTMLTQQDYLDQTTTYIKHLREQIERLSQKKQAGTSVQIKKKEKTTEHKLPMIEVRHKDSSLEVVLISGLNKKFMFHEVIRVLEEEGAEVMNASFSVVGDKIFHTIHCQEHCPTICLEASKVYERLMELIA